MRRRFSQFSLAQAACLSTILSLLLAFSPKLRAQAPAVPLTFQDLYTQLDNYLVNFNATLGPGNGTTYPTLMAGSLKAANSNVGPQLLTAMSGTQLSSTGAVQAQINALKAMGFKTIMVQVGFPVLYQPFLTSQGQSYTGFQNFYQAVAKAVRSAGMKLVVENDTLLTNNVSAGWDAAPFYATLNWTQYQQARAQTALTIAQIMQPDYMVVLEEPDTEAANTKQINVNTAAGATALLSQILTTVQQAGVPNVKLGAGVGTWLNGYQDFIQGFVALPVDFIDFHIYSVNNNFLANALQIASMAAAAGKAVGMTEAWLSKERDTELNALSPDQVRARNPFSFWAPLDAYFIQTLANMANYTQMAFLTPYSSEYYFVYQDYDAATQLLTPGQILSQENSMVSAANQVAQYSSTGMSFYNAMVQPADTTAPATPGGLSGVSGNPTTVALSWTNSTDNVGVAGYYVLRNGQTVGVTAEAYYVDGGLTEATTYAYAIQAFDLAGNTSAATPTVNVQSSDKTPPTPPGNVSAKASSCTKATITWSASVDNNGVSWYLLFMGLSPSSLTQIATVNGNTTTYSNYTLSPATTYYFAVQAQDKNQNVSYMSNAAVVTTPAPPVAPGSVSPVATSTTKVSVTWSAASGGLPIAHYLVYRGTSTSSLSQVATVNATSYTDMNVAPATTYYYAVQAQDSGTPPAQSGLSDLAVVTTFAPPAAPANLVVTPKTCTTVSLSWSPAASGGLPIANYHVYKGATAGGMTQLTVTTNTTFTDTAELPQTTYYYAVQAADSGKPQTLSAISAAVRITTYGYPSVPTNLTGSAASSTKISLTWSGSTSGGLPIGYYHVYRGTSPSGMSQIGTTLSPSYINVSLTAGTTYYYAVQAADTLGDASALSPSVQVTTLRSPSIPVGISAVGGSSTQINISWSPSSADLPIGHYNIFRGSTSANMSQVGSSTKPSYTDRSLSRGTTYYYGIQAADTAGDLSLISPAVAGSTQP